MNLFGGHKLISQLKAHAAPAERQLIGGVNVYPSSAFPMHIQCSPCGGSGEGGDEATYCLHCSGGGGSTVNGVMIHPYRHQTVLIRQNWPRRFEPSFPFAVPLRKVRGPVAIDWPRQ